MDRERFLSADIDPAKETNLSELKQRALQVVHRALADDRPLMNRAMRAIANEYEDMDAAALLDQLRTFSLILDALGGKTTCQEMVGFLTTLLRTGIHRVAGDALDAITVRRDAVQIEIAGRSTIIGRMNGDLLTILALGKETREAERQLTAVEALIDHRDDHTMAGVSRAFTIPIGEVRTITRFVDRLFDDGGRFVRQAFEVTLDDLARHGKHAFELLWRYANVLEDRSNRGVFLNALQHLNNRIRRPQQALRFLLTDFCRHPGTVFFSDRNAIMLASTLLRTYNQELDVEIEMTPEEVLNVRNGLNAGVVEPIRFRIDAVESRFATKVRAIHETLLDRLAAPAPDHGAMPVRHLLLLEREIFIFLALLAGQTARRVLTSALNEYGHPKAGIYRYSRSTAHLPIFFQQLKIIARCVGRVGMRDDLALLHTISAHGRVLAEMYGTRENQPALMRTRQSIDTAMRRIASAGPTAA